MAISQRRVVRSTSLLVLGWGFQGRRIQRRHFRFDQIQDGGRRPSWKTSNGHISATRRPIDFLFGSRLGFSGTADPTAPFLVRPNSRWRPAAILKIISGHDSQQVDFRDILQGIQMYVTQFHISRLCTTHAVEISNNLNTPPTRARLVVMYLFLKSCRHAAFNFP